MNLTISLKLLDCYCINKEKLPDKEIVKLCILISNKDLEGIINSFTKNELLFILNAYIKNSEINYIKIKHYHSFLEFLDAYSEMVSESIREKFKATNINGETLLTFQKML